MQTDATKETSKQKTKKRRTRKIRSKGRKKSKGHTQESNESKEKPREKPGETSKQTQAKDEDKFSTKSSEGGSVIVDKVHEHLQAALDAYNSRITPLTKIPKKLQEYPNLREEKVRLVVHQQLIHRDTQTMLEGPPLAIRRR